LQTVHCRVQSAHCAAQTQWHTRPACAGPLGAETWGARDDDNLGGSSCSVGAQLLEWSASWRSPRRRSSERAGKRREGQINQFRWKPSRAGPLWMLFFVFPYLAPEEKAKEKEEKAEEEWRKKYSDFKLAGAPAALTGSEWNERPSSEDAKLPHPKLWAPRRAPPLCALCLAKTSWRRQGRPATWARASREECSWRADKSSWSRLSATGRHCPL